MDKLQEILQRESIEHSMLARVPMRDPKWDAMTFIELTKSGQPTPPDLIEYVRHEIEATCAADAGDDERQYEAYMKGLDGFWPALEAKMRLSYGLAEYMRTLACHSLFLPRYYATLYHPMALLAPYAVAVRIDGKFMSIPTSDPAYKLCAREPIFVTARTRTPLQQQVQLELGEDANVTSLCAAMLPEYKFFGWQERGIKQNVVAYDNAKGVLDCFRQLYPGDPSDYGIDYRVADFWGAFKDPDLQSAQDLVAMEGGLSYYVNQTGELLQGVAGLLRPGGYFCGETELMHAYTVRCGVLGWQMDQQMLPDASADAAIDRISAEAKRAGLKVCTAYVDDRNAQPAMVWFKLQKV